MFAPQPIDNNNNNPNETQHETLRRQQIMRFGLIICLLFLILDSGNQANQSPPSTRGPDLHSEIPLADQYSNKIQSILNLQSPLHKAQNPLNSTGLYRGPWNIISEQNLNSSKDYSSPDGSILVQLVSVPVKNLPDLSFVYGLLHLYKQPDSDSSHVGAAGAGEQDVGFPVQGVVVSSQRKMVLFSTPYRSQRLYVRLASKHHYENYTTSDDTSGVTNSVSSIIRNSSDRAVGEQAAWRRRLTEDGEAGSGEDGSDFFDSSHSPSYEEYTRYNQLSVEYAISGTDQLQDFHPQLSFARPTPSIIQKISSEVVRRVLTSAGPVDGVAGPSGDMANHFTDSHFSQRSLSAESISNTDAHSGVSGMVPLSMQLHGFGAVRQVSGSEVLLSGLTELGFLSVLLADQPLTARKANATVGNNNSTATTASSTATNATIISNSNSNSSSGISSSSPQGEFLVSIAIGETALPGKFKVLQSTALPPSLRPPTPITWGNRTLGVIHTRPSSQECQYSGLLDVATKGSRAEVQDAASDAAFEKDSVTATSTVQTRGLQSVTAVRTRKGRVAPKSNGSAHPGSSGSKPGKLEAALSLGGVLSSGDCAQSIRFEASAFSLDFNALKVKVELYALIASMLSLVQVFLVVYQMNHSSTQAQASKISLVSLFGQSLLDANLCMAHMLLSFAFPSVFFASFIWICVLKMLLFSVLQMRIIINTYQARYAQELAAEGMSGMRRRLIGLHAAFYGVLLLVLLVSVVFHKRPVVAVFAMYSFWLPQVVYSAYTGTRHAYHPLYLIGVSLTQMFIPLYILGCPNNFISMLTVYTNPHYLAEIAGERDVHSQDLHRLSVSSVSACYVLVVWMALQVGMLLLQSYLGPRFFVPRSWLPQRYDYKRSIPDTMRAAFPLSNSASGASSAGSNAGSGGDGTPHSRSLSRTSSSGDGDIAMTGIRSRGTASSVSNGSGGAMRSGLSRLQALFGYGRSSASASNEGEEDLETGRLLGDNSAASAGGSAHSAHGHGDSNPGGMECAICCNLIYFNSRDNLITPCEHVFHEECLERWGQVKLECPVCRSALPPLGDD